MLDLGLAEGKEFSMLVKICAVQNHFFFKQWEAKLNN